jgi:hypothetical protein
MPDKHDDWTVRTAMEHLEAVIQEADRRYEQRFAAQQDAMRSALASATLAAEKAEANGEKWRASANEWREAMNDRERQFLPRTEAAQIVKGLEDKITSLAQSRDESKGRSMGANALYGYMVGVIGALAAVGALVYALTKNGR